MFPTLLSGLADFSKIEHVQQGCKTIGQDLTPAELMSIVQWAGHNRLEMTCQGSRNGCCIGAAQASRGSGHPLCEVHLII